MGKTGERRPQMVSQTSTEHDNSKEDSTDPPPKKPGSKAAGRKRTKTGCLTCRKRRIKCGEERPKCQNCVKSKRHCEGYNQRVIFKDPLNAYRPPQSTPAQVSFTTPILGQPPTRHGDQHAETTAGTIQPLAPRPTGAFSASTKSSDSSKIFTPSPVSPGSERRFYNWADDPSNQASPDLRLSPKQQPHSDIRADLIDRPWIPEPRKEYVTKMQVAHYDFNALVKTEGGEKSPHRPAQISPLDWSTGPSPTVPYHQPFPTPLWMLPSVSFPPGPPGHPRPSQAATPSAKIIGFFDGPEGANISQSRGQLGIQPHWELSNPQTIDSRPDIGSPLGERQISPDEAEDPFDISDEDTMMGEDEDEPWEEELQDDHLKNNDLGIVVALQASQDNQAFSLRSFTSFIDRPNMLATYVPSIQTTPMRDRMTATIFCHFVNVTGPSMSMFERHPANPSLMFQGAPVPRSQQHIWAYTFPTLALQNPALLHAMLALASLHIAKLQNGPIAASLKHYAIGLRRVAKSVSLPTRRGHPATLAAAMLLAFYECWSADHQKWSNHLLGAKQLVREIDFVGMTRYLKNRRALQRLEEQAKLQQAQMHPFDDRTRFLSAVDEVDENLVGILMGKKVRYDQYGQVMEDFVSEPCWTREYTERDLEIYETQRDLFWWYCKQDVYQSILGGGRLFMDYTLWSHCPPRAPLGRLNATYGTFDHLILLMGRLADFAAKDLKRKRLAMKVNGGWRPPTSMQQATTSPTPQTPTMMPGFSGMVPGVKEAQLPMGFSDSRDTSTSPQSARSEDLDLSSVTAAAEEEWLSIRNAFSVLEDHFGGDFQALGPEFSAPIETPFGPALQYRTYGIAGIWMNYYMGLIVCHRSHPSMPPASMVAAGIMRRQTEWYANELGRIAAGIAPDCAVRDGVNPGVGAALIESSTCLFVSAIQYQDPSQRHWTISRLRHIARLTGWQTALAIASGCEASWVKTGELGKGPPYTRMSPHECMYPEDPNHPKHPNHPNNLNNPNHPSAYNANRDGSYRQSNGWRGEGEIRNLLPDICINSRRIDRAFEGKSPQERRNVMRGTDRVHYALGVLGLDEDFVGLEVGDDG